jgi:excinuclease UvrABC nuclease subunit
LSASEQILASCAEFSPEGDFEAFLKCVPARWVVYLLADGEDKPVQLLCVKNLRYSLKRRLGGLEEVGPSKRVNYRDLVRRVYWRRVDSAFEADWIYYEAARRYFPQTYQGMVGFRPAWFVHVNPEAKFPRYTKTIDLSVGTGRLIGPFEDKHAAARWIQLVEDAFDLCRYYNVLVEAPTGKACAYKEMGKCPAPCDGSIGMEQYRRLIEWSAEVAVDPTAFVAEQTQRMAAAAGELRFEAAGKIKAYVEQVSHFGKGAFRHARLLADFRFASLQRGPTDGTAKVFVVTPGEIEEVAGAVDVGAVSDVLLAVQRCPHGGEGMNAERIGVVSHHLFAAKQTDGVYLRLEGIDEKAVAKGLRELAKQKVKEAADEEGLMKELQSM